MVKQPPYEIEEAGYLAAVKVIPIKTRVLVPGDDIVDVAREALPAAGIEAEAGDILAICESPLAITQGRVRRIDEMKVGLPARIMCRFLHVDSSVGTAYGMQAAIDEAGLWRVAAALLLAGPTRLLGRRGDFYRIAGRQVAWLDDPPAGMPPYTQDIILGPFDPEGVARRVAGALGCGAAVVDANNTGTFEIMGTSPGVDRAIVAEAMRDNPQGQSDEQTPLVLIRP